MNAAYTSSAGQPTAIRPPHMPDLATFVPLLQDATGHLHMQALDLSTDADRLRRQLLALAGQAAGIERLARQALDAIARRAA